MEFGLKLLVSESAEGLIIPCHLVPDRIVNDTTLLLPAIALVCALYGDTVASTVVTDRGFTSVANNTALEKLGITNGTLPRNLEDLKERMQDPTHCKLHKRRAQTEARIGIFNLENAVELVNPPDRLLLSNFSCLSWPPIWCSENADVVQLQGALVRRNGTRHFKLRATPQMGRSCVFQVQERLYRWPPIDQRL